jgi:hypothetical protein
MSRCLKIVDSKEDIIVDTIIPVDMKDVKVINAS